MRLTGEQIYLAPLEAEHCRALTELYEYDLADNTELPGWGASPRVAGDQWFSEIQRDHMVKHLRLGVFLPDGTVIGDVALQDLDWRTRSCSVGQSIAASAHRGKGYGTQALRLLLSYGFDVLGLERVSATTLAHNTGARHSLEKAGFTLEGTRRRAEYLGGRYYDKVDYAILADEFRTARL